MKIWLAFGALCLVGCDSLLSDNPRNCDRHPAACGPDEYCELGSKSCKPRDCTISTTLCQAAEYCSPETKRCTPKDCVVDAALCAVDQRCNAATRSCDTLSFVLGQPDEVQNAGLAYGMNQPEQVRLIPDAQDATKTKVLVGNSYNRTNRTLLDTPFAALEADGRLYVTSLNQSRVLWWSQIPTQNGQPADGVIGQPDFVSSLPNNPELAPIERMTGPVGLLAIGTQLLICDVGYNRVVVRGRPR